MSARRPLGSVLLFLAAAAGCGTDGTTPSCEDYPSPYDVRVQSRRADVWEKLSGPAADPNYCTIVPAGFVPSSGGGANLAGAGGSAGMDTSAGSAGQSDVDAGSGGDLGGGGGGAP